MLAAMSFSLFLLDFYRLISLVFMTKILEFLKRNYSKIPQNSETEGTLYISKLILDYNVQSKQCKVFALIKLTFS